MSRVAWLDVTNGVSGDMLLGALVAAGVPLERMTASLDPLKLPISLRVERVDRAGLAATKVMVKVRDDHHMRTWRDIRDLLSALDDPLRTTATKVFAALAEAEASVHGLPPDNIHFHEVGALDAIADVVATCAGLLELKLDRIVVSPIALGGGSAHTAHGIIPVPAPAVLALASAARAPVFGGPDNVELATPTGVALATGFASVYGSMPSMTPEVVGVGAGSRNPRHRPNVVRIVVGEPGDADTEPPRGLSAHVLEANIDDMDPRMWPSVLSGLLEAGAGDAWLIPIAMKKGRPAHTLCAIVASDRVEDVRAAIFASTTTIGIRESTVAKHALRRDFRSVTVDGEEIAVKLGILPDGRIINAMPEWEDVSRVAAAIKRPVKSVLSQAVGLAAEFTTR